MALAKPKTNLNTNQETLTEEGVKATAEVEEVQQDVQETETAAEETQVTPEAEGASEVEQASEAEVEAEEPEEQKQVAVAKGSAVAAVNASQAAMANFTKEQADQGYDGLDLTGLSFDRIKLHEGIFKLGSEETDIGKEFDCVIQATKRLYVVRQSSDNDSEAFYSYDPKGTTSTDGSESKLQEWIEDGYEETIEIKEYLEAVALLVNRDDEYDQSMVMLSIPPASRPRVAGVTAQAQFRLKARNLSEVVIKATVGKQVGTGTTAFKPWNFSLVGRFEG